MVHFVVASGGLVVCRPRDKFDDEVDAAARTKCGKIILGHVLMRSVCSWIVCGGLGGRAWRQHVYHTMNIVKYDSMWAEQ